MRAQQWAGQRQWGVWCVTVVILVVGALVVQVVVVAQSGSVEKGFVVVGGGPLWSRGEAGRGRRVLEPRSEPAFCAVWFAVRLKLMEYCQLKGGLGGLEVPCGLEC